MNGWVWFGHGRHSGNDGALRRNLIRRNDFTETVFTDNVGWRSNFPVGHQRWPAGFTPVHD